MHGLKDKVAPVTGAGRRIGPAIAEQIADEGVKVAALDVAPDNPKLIEALKRAVPFGRIGEPHEIAAAIAFLAPDDGAFITGQTPSVSGGLTTV